MSRAAAPRAHLFGWYLYDWANSAYVTAVTTALLPVYFAAVVVPPEGVNIFGTLVGAEALWGFLLSATAFFVFIFAPFLGALADQGGYLKPFMGAFCLLGGAAASFLFLAGPGEVALVILLFSLGQIGFFGANIFYDAYLVHIAPPERMDHVSSVGFAWGYLGGGLHLGLVLLLVTFPEAVGLTAQGATRLALASAGVWWVLFGLTAVGLLPRTPGVMEHPSFGRAVSHALRQVRATFRLLGRGPAGRFMLAFLFFNDGIQTVIVLASIYGKEQLGLSLDVLMLTLLVTQFVALGGALLFARLAERVSAKRALLLSLFCWVGVVCYAYVITTAAEFFILGVLVGVILGGSQSLSRSLFAVMVPRELSAQYFSYYAIVQKFSAIGGPLLFALVRQITGTSRLGILAIIVLFAVGIVLLLPVRPPERA